MARRSTNSHQLKIKALPFIARLRREPPFSTADERELKDAANRIAGPTGWYSMAGFRPETCARLYRFATAGEADDMQRWINESGIENRPPPKTWDGPQLTVAGGATGQEAVAFEACIRMNRASDSSMNMDSDADVPSPAFGVA